MEVDEVPTVSPRFHTVNIRDTHSDNTSQFTVPKRYSNLQFLSAGAQGTVVSADDTVTKTRVAIKKMQQPFIMPMSAKRAYREFVLLSSIKHPNIIRMISAFTPQEQKDDFREVYLVMELMNHNLHEVIMKLKLDHKTLSFFIYQSLCAINHLHQTGIIHRDLKPSNMVVDERCILKVLDFGLARKATFDSAVRMSDYVVTRYYRAPEIILGLPYSEKVDIWSIGCIFAEMINHRVLFPGRDRVDQWSKIVNIMGTPSQTFISRLAKPAAEYVNSLPKADPKPMEQAIPDENFLGNTEQPQAHLTAKDARRLISKMLAIDPNERYSVADALNDPYVKLWFREEEVNAHRSDSRYKQELDFADHSLTEWKCKDNSDCMRYICVISLYLISALIFDEVKRFESHHDVYGGL
ncbi:hypothetical protein PFISCL1PPCAC_15448 [Pristionchus fissidentatus]|uniref:Stress-activated protein kinase JNK n=1 Tax=Pristionchus fissidentatus TaxID=1538716 RepID=A0AAV5VWJ3_9BILA|nr:hypothetical protein PFISCL1PPCAC_15448 [Pristionchus fissidentatus]